MSTKALVTLLAAALLLSGCASEDAEPTTADDAADDPTGPADDNATQEQGNETVDDDPADDPDDGNETSEVNTAPEAFLEASTVNGTAPLNVTFTLDGSDADGDNLTWSFDADGDGEADAEGTELPATANFAYMVDGTFNATLHVSDGSNATSDILVITAVAGAGSDGPAAVVSGATSLPGNPTTSVLLGANGCAGFYAGESGTDCVFGELPDGLEGHAFILESDATTPDYELWDSCDPVDGTFIQGFGGPSDGTMPAGVGCVVMWNYGDGTGSFTFTVF